MADQARQQPPKKPAVASKPAASKPAVSKPAAPMGGCGAPASKPANPQTGQK